MSLHWASWHYVSFNP